MRPDIIVILARYEIVRHTGAGANWLDIDFFEISVGRPLSSLAACSSLLDVALAPPRAAELLPGDRPQSILYSIQELRLYRRKPPL